MDERRSVSLRIALASLVLSAALLLVGWYDYTSTRTELLTLLVDQAASMRQAVAAAASLGEAASAQTQAATAARLLDNARLLRALDARGGLWTLGERVMKPPSGQVRLREAHVR